MRKNFTPLLLIFFLFTTSCTRLFKNEEAPPPKKIKSGLISPSEGAPIGGESPDKAWAQSIGEGIYKVGKPYKVNGVWYFPKEDPNYDEVGYASWYGPDFHNKRTANGEIFDMNMLSAAHKTLPLPCVARVTNLQNGRSLVLRINDRGPFVNDRILDVSRKAAQLLGFKDQGTTKVRVEVLPEESMTVASLTQNSGYINKNTITPAESGEVSVADDLEGIASFGNLNESPIGKDLPGANFDASPQQGLFDDKPFNSISRKEEEGQVPVISEEEYNRQLEESLRPSSPVEQTSIQAATPPVQVVQPQAAPIAPAAPSGKQFYIQAGAFSSQSNAHRLTQKLQHAGPTGISERQTARGTFYKVRVGPFDSVSQARQALQKVVSSGHPDAHIIKD